MSRYYCSFGLCNSSSTPGRPGYDPRTKFFSFPQPCLELRERVLELDRNEERRHVRKCPKCSLCWDWMVRCRRIDEKFSSIRFMTHNYRICSKHFPQIEGKIDYHVHRPSSNPPKKKISKYRRVHCAPEPSTSQTKGRTEANHGPREGTSDPNPMDVETTEPSFSIGLPRVYSELTCGVGKAVKVACEICDKLFVSLEMYKWHRFNEHKIGFRKPSAAIAIATTAIAAIKPVVKASESKKADVHQPSSAESNQWPSSSLDEIMEKVIMDASIGSSTQLNRGISIGPTVQKSKIASPTKPRSFQPVKHFLCNTMDTARRSQSVQPSSVTAELRIGLTEQVSTRGVERDPLSTENDIIQEQNHSPDAMDQSTHDEIVKIKIEDYWDYEHEEQEMADDTSELPSNSVENDSDPLTMDDGTREEVQTGGEEFECFQSVAEQNPQLARKYLAVTTDYACLKSKHVKKGSISDETAPLKAKIAKLEADVTKLKSDLVNVNNDNVSLRVELQASKRCMLGWDESNFEGNDAKTKFYTSVPTFTLLRGIFELVSSEVREKRAVGLSKFQEFLLVLMRLRVGLLIEDLAFRFGIKVSTVSRIVVSKWIKPIASKLISLIVWPNRDEVRGTYPECVQKVFGDRFVVIVDVLELTIGLPVFAINKSSTTPVNFLIGYTPQGTICYVSGMWKTSGDRVQFTELLDQLHPEDVVIAGKNFDFAEELGLHLTSSGFQVYTKLESQLSFPKSIKTKECCFLSQRVTSLIKKRFRLLQSDLPRTFLAPPTDGDETLVSYVVTLCCGLINICQPVEPHDLDT